MPFEVPNEAFMALSLQEDALEKISGIVEYSRAFFNFHTLTLAMRCT